MLFLNAGDNFLNGLQQPEIGIFFIQIAWMLLVVFGVQEMRSELERHSECSCLCIRVHGN